MTPEMSEDLMLMAMIGLATMGLVLLGYVIWQGVAGSERRMRRRIAAARGERQMPAETLATVRRDDGEGKGLRVLQALSPLMPRRDNLKLRLSASGLKLSPVGYLMASLLTAVVTLLSRTLWAGWIVALAVPGAVAAGFLLPHMAISFLIGRRQSKFAARFPDALVLIVRSLKSGLPVTEAMTMGANAFSA